MSESKEKPKGPPVVAAIVTKLSDLLALAKIGEIQAFAYVAVTHVASIGQGRIEPATGSRDLALGIGDLAFACATERASVYQEPAAGTAVATT